MVRYWFDARTRPFALAMAASACAGGPMIAIDFPGGEAKVRATTRANQPAATSTNAPTIRRSGRHPVELTSIVIEMLDGRAGRLEIAVNLDEAVDPRTQASPAEA